MLGPFLVFAFKRESKSKQNTCSHDSRTQGVESLPIICFIHQIQECLLPCLLVPAWRNGC